MLLTEQEIKMIPDFKDLAQIYQQRALESLSEEDLAHAKRYRIAAELEYQLNKQAEVHAYEKEALQHQIKMLSDPIVRQKMLEPAPPIYIEADKFVYPRIAELEAVLRECREAFAEHCAAYLGHESNVKEAIAKIDEVLPE